MATQQLHQQPFSPPVPPIASTSTAPPARKLNPQSQAFSFLQPDQISSSPSSSGSTSFDRGGPNRVGEQMNMHNGGGRRNGNNGMGGMNMGMNMGMNQGGMMYGSGYPMEAMMYGQPTGEWGQHHHPNNNKGWQMSPQQHQQHLQQQQQQHLHMSYQPPPPSSYYSHPQSPRQLTPGGIYFPQAQAQTYAPPPLPPTNYPPPLPQSPPPVYTSPTFPLTYPSSPATSAPRTRRLRPPPPSEAPALSFGPYAQPPPGIIPSVLSPESDSTSTSNSSLVVELSTSPISKAEVESTPSTPTSSKTEASPPASIPKKKPSVPIIPPISTAASSTQSSPLLAPLSPTTTVTTVSDSETTPTAPLPPVTQPDESPIATTATPVVPIAPIIPPPKKSWADLLKSQSSSSTTTPGLTPIQQYIPIPPTSPKSLAALLSSNETSFKPPNIVPRGLINNGNLCFANAILQVLVWCAPFWNLVEKVGRETKGSLGKSQTMSLDAMILFLQEFKAAPSTTAIVHHRTKSSLTSFPMPSGHINPSSDAFIPPSQNDWSDPFVPEQLYESLKSNSRFDAMRMGQQEDAEEFLGFFLDTLHEEILVMIDRDEGRNGGKGRKEVEQKEEWLEVGSKGRTATTRTTEMRESPITKIFGGQLRSVLRSSGQKDSVTLEPYQRLQLDIQPNNVRTIEDALISLTHPEALPDFISRTGIPSTKQFFIETLPPVLVLHLKRFEYDNVGGVLKNSKIVGYGTELTVSEAVLAPSKRVGGKGVGYSLFGVVYHHGQSASGGHYTVAVRQQLTNSWVHIDDTSVRPISERDVAVSKDSEAKGKDAYLLLYTRLP